MKLCIEINPFFTGVADNDASLSAIKDTEVNKYKDQIKAEEEAQYNASSYEELISAKKEAVGLQLEAEYRNRLHTAYDQVNAHFCDGARFLSYFLEVTYFLIRHTHMKIFHVYPSEKILIFLIYALKNGPKAHGIFFCPLTAKKKKHCSDFSDSVDTYI